MDSAVSGLDLTRSFNVKRNRKPESLGLQEIGDAIEFD